MTFVVALALLIGLLTIIPIVAHFFRRGRARELKFPATRWIPELAHTARHRSHFDERALLALRASIIIGLALLGATPLVRCERAVLARHAGASIAAVIVLDDSGSMRNRMPDGGSRYSHAKRAALELIEQVREGDSIGLVLAGKPARMLLLPSTNRTLLRNQIVSAKESDRSTDLVGALALAESALDRLPHVDKRILLLSDLSGELPKLSARVALALPELATPANDCGVVTAVRSGGQVAVDVACTANYPKTERSLQIVRATRPSEVLLERAFEYHGGQKTYFLPDASHADASVRLTGVDDNPHDDQSPIIERGFGPIIATYSDPAAGRASTGGPPILEQALRALDRDLTIRPLTTVPEDAHELSEIGLLLLDDPPLFSAESRHTVSAFAERGGIAVAFLGPNANAAQLGSLLLPFIERRAGWEESAPAGLDASSLSLLGSAAESLNDLSPHGRLLFDESQDPKVMVRGRWSDHQPFWIERPMGRGYAIAFGLPVSVEHSDWALRSGFIATLEHLLAIHRELGSARVVTVGQAWRFRHDAPIAVEGPSGPVVHDRIGSKDASDRIFVPTEVGRYLVKQGTQSEQRVALLAVEEVLEAPRSADVAAPAQTNKAAGRFDLSNWLVYALLPLLGLELAMGSSGFRAFLRNRWQLLRRRGATLQGR